MCLIVHVSITSSVKGLRESHRWSSLQSQYLLSQVGGYLHLQYEKMQLNLCSATLLSSVKPTQLQSDPGSSRLISRCILRPPDHLRVQDKQADPGPSTSSDAVNISLCETQRDRICPGRVLQAPCSISQRPPFPHSGQGLHSQTTPTGSLRITALVYCQEKRDVGWLDI